MFYFYIPEGICFAAFVALSCTFSLKESASLLLFPFSLLHNDRPPLWSSGQSSWLQIQRSGFNSRRYQTFRVVVGLERGPLSLVSTSEEILERKSSGSGLESREYGRRDTSR
jgi:hypothetical protein